MTQAVCLVPNGKTLELKKTSQVDPETTWETKKQRLYEDRYDGNWIAYWDNAKETEILAIDEKVKMQLTIWYAHVSDGGFM